MNIVNKLTLRHLKENKKRTVITVIGIIISVAMITATCVSVTSLLSFLEKSTLYNSGEWHCQLPSATAEQVQKLSENRDLKYVAQYTAHEEEGYGFNLHNKERESLGVGSIGAGNRDFFSAFLTAPYKGNVPADETEIMVTQDFLTKNKLDWKIGDIVTIDIGKRTQTYEDGTTEPVFGRYSIGEEFQSLGEKKFTVVGILEEKNEPTRSCSILRGLSAREYTATTVYLTANSFDKDTETLLNNAAESAGFSPKDLVFHRDLFRYNLILRDADPALATIAGFSTIILVIIIIASVMLIYNAFGISISERSHYLGMLASVGATRTQKRNSVYFEGFVLGLIGIPLGFGAGILGMYITFQALQPLIENSGLNTSDSATLVLDFPWWILLVIAAVSAVTIAISAFVPAKRASKTTPIDSLRQNTDIKVKAKHLRSPRIVRMIFGYEGELAYKNMKRNGKKSRVITSSLVLSVVLFLSVNTFCSMFSEANKISSDIPYQIAVITDDMASAAKFRADAAKLDGVNAMYGVENLMFQDLKTDKAYFKKAYADNYGEKGFTLYVSIVDDTDFNAFCRENGMDHKTFYDTATGLPILMLNGVDRTETAAKLFEDSIVGTSIAIGNDSETFLQLNVQGLISYKNSDNYCYGLLPAGVIGAYAPKSAVEKLSLTTTDMIGFETDDHEKLSNDLMLLGESGEYGKISVMDYQEQAKMMNSTIMIIQVFMYGFIALMTLIAAANIFNTVSTSIDLRRKEFAMLKSVGVTPKGFRRMLQFESLFYGLKALIYGLPLSIGISLLMWYALNEGSITIPFHLDWRIYLGVTVAVFLIVGLSMLYSTSKVKKDTIISALKSEVI